MPDCWDSISALVEIWVLEVENDNEEDRKVTKLLATIIHSQSTWDPNAHRTPKISFYDVLIICPYYLELFLYMIIKNLCHDGKDPNIFL